MSYISEMRAIIGNGPLMLVATSVIAYKAGKILLQRRADNGLWGYPGGYMEMGETPEASAIREFYEETGYIANQLELYGVFAGEARHFTYPNGHEVYVTDIVYLCSDFTETDAGFDSEVLEIKWFDSDCLPETLMESTRDILHKFIDEALNG